MSEQQDLLSLFVGLRVTDVCAGLDADFTLETLA